MRRIVFVSFVVASLLFSCNKNNSEESTVGTEDLETAQNPIELLEKRDLQTESFDREELVQKLKKNPNVEFAYYSDDKALLIKEKNNRGISVFPTESSLSFEDFDKDKSTEKLFLRPIQQTAKTVGKIAIFNYFDGIKGRKGQNKIIEDLYYLFQRHNYAVEYYGYKDFTKANVDRVVNRSDEYAVVIVMSHGFIANNIAYYALGEKYDDSATIPWEVKTNPFAASSMPKVKDEHQSWYYRVWEGTRYNAVGEVKALATAQNCILYVGSCEAFSPGLKTIYANNPKTYVGWTGVNKYSQAHAGLLFNRMLQEELSLEGALKSLWQQEEEGVKMVSAGNKELRLISNPNELRKSATNLIINDYAPNLGSDIFFKVNPVFSGNYQYTLEGKIVSDNMPNAFYIGLQPVDRTSKTHVYKVGIKKDKKTPTIATFKKKIELPNSMLGIYNVIAGANKDLSKDFISLMVPKSFIYSTSFKENSAQVLMPFEGNSIQVSFNDEEIETLTLAKEEQKILTIEEYEDYSYTISVDKPEILEAQISSISITLKGKMPGQTNLIIQCKETRGKTILPITVTNEIAIPDGVIIENGVLKKWPCNAIPANGHVVIPNTVTEIGDWAFNPVTEYKCTNLKKVTIPNSVKKIGQAAFANSGLIDVVIPNSVESIGIAAFRDCKSLKSVVLSNSMEIIPQEVFRDCASLTSVVIPNSITNIKHNAFNNCISLKNIEIPNSVEIIENGVFRNCKSLTDIEIPNSVNELGQVVFDGTTNLKNVVLSNSITVLSSNLFYGSGVTNITIPNSVTIMHYSVFSGCTNLKTITIPESVVTIGYFTFKDCTSLETIKCKANQPPSMPWTSSEHRTNLGYSGKLIVPRGTKQLYEQAEGWKNCNPIVEE